MKILKLFWVVELILIAGCSSAGRQPLSLADELQYTEAVRAAYRADRQWWKQYGNAELNRLVETALANNPDYLKAALNIDKELYNLDLATSDLFPTVFAGLDAASQRRIYTGDHFSGNFSGEIGLNYEVDLYGKIRDRRQAQLFEYEATVMDREAAKLSLINSVVDLYFNLAYLQNSIEVAEKNIKSYEGIQRITGEKYDSGKSDNVEFLQSRQSLLSEKNKLLNLETQFKEMETSLKNILAVGRLDLHYGDILKQKTSEPNLDVPLAVLANRPDLLAEQYRLEKAFANLKAEEKNWYPDISLKGALNSSSDKARTTFDFPSILGGVSVNLPFLDWNRVKNNVKISEADYDITLIGFKDSLNQALNEISYYVYAYRKSAAIYDNIRANYDNAVKITQYYRDRYDYGKVEFKFFLEAMNTENSLRESMIQQKYQIIKYENYIYKAMAGRY